MSGALRNIQPIIVGAGAGKRRLSGAESLPKGLHDASDIEPPLVWILNALSKTALMAPVYVGGYHIEKVVQQFPDLKVRVVPASHRRSEISVLTDYPFSDANSYLIMAANMVLKPEALDLLLAGDPEQVAIGYVSEAAEGPTLAYVPSQKVSDLECCLKSIKESGSWDDSINTVVAQLGSARQIDVKGHVAPIDDRDAVTQVVFQGKGRTLKGLMGLVQHAHVLDSVMFSLEEWRENEKFHLRRIQQTFGSDKIVIRSSAKGEDSGQDSFAGMYHSALDVLGSSSADIRTAIEDVFSSYLKLNRAENLADEVLVQKHVNDVKASGVMLTRDPQTGAPYFVVNYEIGSGRTDIVTSGVKGQVKTAYINSNIKLAPADDNLDRLIDLARELIFLSRREELDIEFAFDKAGALYLFQVRPMILRSNFQRFTGHDEDFFELCSGAQTMFSAAQTATYPMVGESTVFTNMSDWNPVEMLGASPEPLALSLYQYLIGNMAWSFAREKIGYRKSIRCPLIFSFGGRPYVDVRASLNSLLPEGLSESLATKLVNLSIGKIKKNPSLQDKIEFDVAVTCLAFDWKTWSEWACKEGVTKSELGELQRALRDLTENMIKQEKYSVDSLIGDVFSLEEFRERNSDAGRSATQCALLVKKKLDFCTEYGLVPFSILARFAFVAMKILRSLVEVGVFTANEYDKILREIPTVASEFSQELYMFKGGRLSREFMVEKYGHLRPHSYDVTSNSYRQDPNVFGKTTGMQFAVHEVKSVRDSEAWNVFSQKSEKIDALLKIIGINVTVVQLYNFVCQSIAAREKSKFLFMKTLDDIFKDILDFGSFVNLKKEELAFLPIQEITRLGTDSVSGATSKRLEKVVRYREKRQNLTKRLRFPDVIGHERDFDFHFREAGKPNFVTHGSAEATALVVESFREELDLNGKIILIRAADPGFDWVFGFQIAGLITEYGGVASHMAIRAAEFGIPAAIGCGSKIFDELVHAKIVFLDCSEEQIGVVC